MFDRAPYRNVVCLNLIVDENGQKMSKSKGNIIAPWDIFSTQGADALRWYFFSSGQPWTPRRVFPDGIRESTRQTLLTLWNVFSFFTTYADLDGWEPDAAAANRPRPPTCSTAGCWASSTTPWPWSPTPSSASTPWPAPPAWPPSSTTCPTGTCDASRPRFWKSSDPAAHATLHECLVTTAQLLAPFCPFLADDIYPALTGAVSVHLSDWPADRGRHDPALAAQVAASRRLVALGRSARTDAKVKVRQPLSRALLLHPGIDLDEAVDAEIRAELNVKSLERIDTLSGLMSWMVVPNFRTLGPRLGPRVNEVKAGAGRGRRLRAAAGARPPTASSRSPASAWTRTTSRSAPSATTPSPWPRTTAGRWPSTSSSTTTCARKVRPASWCAPSTTCARPVAWPCRTASGWPSRCPTELAAALDTHRAWIAGEILAVEVTDGAGEHEINVDGAIVRATLTKVD